MLPLMLHEHYSLKCVHSRWDTDSIHERGGGESNKFLGGENLRPQKGRNKVGNFDAKYLLDVIFQAHIFFWFAI